MPSYRHNTVGIAGKATHYRPNDARHIREFRRSSDRIPATEVSEKVKMKIVLFFLDNSNEIAEILHPQFFTVSK